MSNCAACHKSLTRAVLYFGAPGGDLLMICMDCCDRLEEVRLPREDLYRELFAEAMQDARAFDERTVEMLQEKLKEIREDNSTVVAFPRS